MCSQQAVVYSNLRVSECALLPAASSRKKIEICLGETLKIDFYLVIGPSNNIWFEVAR